MLAMASPLIDYFRKFTRLTPAEAVAIEKSTEIQSVSRKTHLLREGQWMTNTYFVLKGIVRQYQIKEGKEITTYFFTPGDWIIALTGFEDKLPADYYLQAVDDTEVVVGNDRKARELYAQFPGFREVAASVLEKALKDQNSKMRQTLLQSPEERYLELLRKQPKLLQQVPQYQIASYIGVQPESLSRIRKRLSEHPRPDSSPNSSEK